jgi:hypothetical protein
MNFRTKCLWSAMRPRIAFHRDAAYLLKTARTSPVEPATTYPLTFQLLRQPIAVDLR